MHDVATQDSDLANLQSPRLAPRRADDRKNERFTPFAPRDLQGPCQLYRRAEVSLDPRLFDDQPDDDDLRAVRGIGLALLVVTLAIGAVVLLWAKPWLS